MRDTHSRLCRLIATQQKCEAATADVVLIDKSRQIEKYKSEKKKKDSMDSVGE